MKISATFWLKEDDGEELSLLMKMDDLSAPPFKVGDLITIDFERLSAKDMFGYKPETAMKFNKDNEEMKKRLDFKTIEIVRVVNLARFNNLNDGSLTYEYYCQIKEDALA